MSEDKLIDLFGLMEPMIDEDFPRGVCDDHGTVASDDYVAAARAYKRGLELLRQQDGQAAGRAALVSKLEALDSHAPHDHQVQAITKLLIEQAAQLVQKEAALEDVRIMHQNSEELREQAEQQLAAARAALTELRGAELGLLKDKVMLNAEIDRLRKVAGKLLRRYERYKETLHYELPDKYPDNCQVCKGENCGVRGNENVVDGVVICDYCDAKRMREQAQKGGKDD